MYFIAIVDTGAYRRRSPKRLSFCITHTECHERAAVVQIDANPIPANRSGGDIGAGPFVIEPCATRNGNSLCAPLDRAAYCQMRQAVVITCRALDRALA